MIILFNLQLLQILKKKKIKEPKNNIYKMNNNNDTNKRTFNPRLPPYNKRNLSNNNI